MAANPDLTVRETVISHFLFPGVRIWLFNGVRDYENRQSNAYDSDPRRFLRDAARAAEGHFGAPGIGRQRLLSREQSTSRPFAAR